MDGMTRSGPAGAVWRRRAGMTAFFLSGICSLSAGILVSLLRDSLGLSYGFSGALVSVMSAGNMLALLTSGVLPAKLGERATAILLTPGYCLGYLVLALTGVPGLLAAAFLLVGVAKGATANKCTLLVGSGARDKSRALSLMNAWYALGALLCPFLIAALSHGPRGLPMAGVSTAGLLLWLTFCFSGLPGKTATPAEGEKTGSASFLKSGIFWTLTLLLLCHNAAESTVNGWVVTWYKGEGILTGAPAAYTVTVQWAMTLAARLMLVYVIRPGRPWRTLTVMGVGLTAAYALMLRLRSPLAALMALGLFAFSMAGFYPIGVAGIGEMMSAASVGTMLALAALGGILFPALVGLVADTAGLTAGMAVNLLPCLALILLPARLERHSAGHPRKGRQRT
ncbi:MAG: MFS transporter [Clostridia bacterium]|nr:MFS transporter [Clostridia bacterium]